ncbi:alpha/beta hydrolase [Sphaerospermopsis torques-reginae]|nr:alpha/beta hydrolase [Sphaerospermopsis torques-reginae]
MTIEVIGDWELSPVTFTDYQLPIVNYQLSIVNYQLSIVNYQLSIITDYD